MKSRLNLVKRVAMLPFIEQGISSGGSFIFFLLSARFLGPKEFGLFGIQWAVVQFMQALSGQWIFTPISSFPVEKDSEPIFFEVCAYRLMQVLLLTPILATTGLFSLSAGTHLTVYHYLATTILAILTLFTDYLRYLFIRRSMLPVSIRLIATKWFIAICALLLVKQYGLLEYETVLYCLLLGMSLGAILSAIDLSRKKTRIRIRNNKNIARRLNHFSIPIITYSSIMAVFSIATVGLISTFIGSIALGAYQAVKSLCGFISVLTQAINTHYAAYRLKNTATSTLLIPTIIIGGSFILSIVVIPFQGFLIHLLLGDQFVPFAWLLPMILFMVAAQLATNILGADLRVKGDTRIYWYWSGLLLIAAILITLATVATGSLPVIVLSLSALPLAQFFVYLALHGHVRKNKTPGARRMKPQADVMKSECNQPPVSD